VAFFNRRRKIASLSLIDIDGVIADDRHREQYSINKQYVQYFDKVRMSNDAVWEEGRKLVEDRIKAGDTIAYLTGRREDRRQVTEEWLDRNHFPMGRLTMRRFDQTMPLALFKAEYIHDLIASGNFESVVLFDDDPEVIRFVNEDVGPGHAVHCTWHIKPAKMVRAARA